MLYFEISSFFKKRDIVENIEGENSSRKYVTDSSQNTPVALPAIYRYNSPSIDSKEKSIGLNVQ